MFPISSISKWENRLEEGSDLSKITLPVSGEGKVKATPPTCSKALSLALKQPQLSTHNHLPRFSRLGVAGRVRDCLEVLDHLLPTIYKKASQLKSKSESFPSLYVQITKIW